MALSFDMLTALTVSGIVAILAIYVIVVYKKGWLRRNSVDSETYLRCPNKECRKVFKEPIWLTDLSKTPPESYQSCPHCGINLQTTPYFKANADPGKNAVHEPMLSAGDVGLKEKTLLSQKEKPQAKAPQAAQVPKEVMKSSPVANLPKEVDKPLPATKPQVTIPTPRAEAPKKHEEKKLPERPKACSHFFGYVKTLPKSTPIPDECMWCPLIVKCLTGAQELEA